MWNFNSFEMQINTWTFVPQPSSKWDFTGKDFTRITSYVLHIIKWYHLQIVIVLCWNYRKAAIVVVGCDSVRQPNICVFLLTNCKVRWVSRNTIILTEFSLCVCPCVCCVCVFMRVKHSSIWVWQRECARYVCALTDSVAMWGRMCVHVRLHARCWCLLRTARPLWPAH